MIQFEVPIYLQCTDQLARLSAMCLMASRDEIERPQELQQDLRNLLAESVETLTKISSSDLNLSPAMKSLFKGLGDRASSASFEVLSSSIRDAQKALVAEAGGHLFLCLSVTEKQKWEQAEDLFGPEGVTAFPDAKKDMAAAVRCKALNEWTASVFHSMRVLEHGLRPMAKRFNVPFAVDSWHKVIKGIEEGINNLRNKQGLTEQDRKEITHYSDAASQFRHFKDAWRNHVSHAREHYDERDADKVLAHVVEFMQHLAGPV